MQGFSKLRAFVNESQIFLGAVAVSVNISKERKSAYFHKHIGAFVDEFVMADPDKEEVTQHKLLKKRSNLVHVIRDEHEHFGRTRETRQSEVNLLIP